MSGKGKRRKDGGKGGEVKKVREEGKEEMVDGKGGLWVGKVDARKEDQRRRGRRKTWDKAKRI